MTSNIGEDTLWHQVWEELISAATTSDHQFNTPAVANTDESGYARLRTVVLRHCDREKSELYFYTDRRSIKTREMKDHGHFTWLFWDDETQLQFSCRGKSRWLDDPATDKVFSGLKKHARKAYATIEGPSAILNSPGSGLPPDWEGRTLGQTDYARQHFGIIVTSITSAEVLKLDRKGNLRLRAEKSGEDWSFTWITP